MFCRPVQQPLRAFFIVCLRKRTCVEGSIGGGADGCAAQTFQIAAFLVANSRNGVGASPVSLSMSSVV